jgi:hypothetical protein
VRAGITYPSGEEPLTLFSSPKRGRTMSMSERIHRATDVVILIAGFFLTGWFYYELYLAFQISSLVF